jgi:hypothetical protein
LVGKARQYTQRLIMEEIKEARDATTTEEKDTPVKEDNF